MTGKNVPESFAVDSPFAATCPGEINPAPWIDWSVSSRLRYAGLHTIETKGEGVDKMNSWLTLGANIGILIGLLLVAYQINQATEISLGERQSEGFAVSMDTIAMRLNEELPERMARIMTNSEDITDADLVALDGYLIREYTQALRERSMSILGYANSPASSASVSKWVLSNLSNESALRWWNHHQDTGLLDTVPELRDQVNTQLLELGPAHALNHRRLISALRSGAIFGQATDP